MYLQFFGYRVNGYRVKECLTVELLLALLHSALLLLIGFIVQPVPLTESAVFFMITSTLS